MSAEQQPASEPAALPLRTHRRTVTIVMDLDAPSHLSPNAQDFLNGVVASMQEIVKAAAIQGGVHSTFTCTKGHRTIGNGWTRDEQIILPNRSN